MGIWKKTKNMFNAMLKPDNVGEDEATIEAEKIEKEQTNRINELLKQMEMETETKTTNYKNAIKVDGNKSIVNNILHEGEKKLERKVKEQKGEEREN